MEMPELDGLPELGENAYAVYKFALDHATVPYLREAQRQLALTDAAFDGATQHLLSLKLLSATAFESDRLVPVPPYTARFRTLGPALRLVEELNLRIDRASSIYTDLFSTFENSRLGIGREGSIEVLRGLDAVRGIIDELATQCTSEVLISRPGGVPAEDLLRESMERLDEARNRGVEVRILCQHTIRYNPRAVAYVELAARQGARVRTRSDGFMQLLLFDQQAALIELAEEEDSAVFVRDPSVVRFIHRAFERAWLRATRFESTYDPVIVQLTSENSKAAIIEMLVEGVEDKVIARRMGMSLRACQRHISEIMRRLGARNRMHAGYLLGQQSQRALADPDRPEPSAQGTSSLHASATPSGADRT
jgi:hypothetical protein